MDQQESLDELFAGLGPDTSERRNPFKFLDAYGPADRAIFFGRDEEIRDLYARFYRSRVLLVYGESGTGKTSLIECGLRNEIPPEDALFVTVRINQDPFQAVRLALERIPGAPQDLPLKELLGAIIEAKSKTLVLVFDQFEEFFLFHSEALRRQFCLEVKDWLDSHAKLRLVIALRQEYLAHANELHQHWPGYRPAELWLRRLNRTQAETAITQPCAVCGVELDVGLPEKLLADLSVGGGGVELPILQVVLDKLYQQAITENPQRPRLTLSSYATLGQTRNILARFLEDCLATYGEAAEPARQVLKTLVTSEGTRRPASHAEIAERLPAFGAELDDAGLLDLLKRLVDDRILREDTNRQVYELRHDTLAAHIHHWMSGLEEELVEIRQMLENRLQEYRRRGRLLEAKVLADLAPYEHRLRFTGELAELVAQSKSEAAREKRHRLGIVSAVAGAFLVVFGLSVFAYLGWQKAEEQTKQADTNANTAKHFIDEFLTQESESAFFNKPGMEPKRRQLFVEAENYYRELSKQKAVDPEALGELADAFLLLAQIKQMLGDSDGAKNPYRQSIAAHEVLARDPTGNPDHRNHLEESYIKLARLLQNDAATIKDAEALIRKALDVGELLARQHPEAKYQKTLAQSYFSLARLKHKAGQKTEAETAFNKARSIREQIAREHPDQPEYQIDLARSYSNPNFLQRSGGGGGEANYLKAIQIQEQLAKEYPKIPAYWNGLARSYNNLGQFKQGIGRADEAEAAYRKAIEIRKPLFDEYPDMPIFQRGLAQSHSDLGLLQAVNGSTEDAGDSYRESLQYWERLSPELQGDTRNLNEIAVSHTRFGILLRDTGHGAEAETHLRKAMEIGEALLKQNPEAPEYRNNFALSVAHLGILQRDTGHAPEAEASLLKAMGIGEQLQQRQPEMLEYRSNLAMVYNNLGRLKQSTGQAAQAEDFYGKAIKTMEPLAKQRPDMPEYQNRLMAGYAGLGRSRQSTGHEAEAQTFFRQALEIGGRLTREHPNVPDYQSTLASVYNSLGNLQHRAGNAAQAGEYYAKAVAIRERLARGHPDMPAYQSDLAQSLNNAGNLERARGNPTRVAGSRTGKR